MLLILLLILLFIITIVSLSYNEIEDEIDTEILSYMKSYCPVSSSFDTEFDSIHGYPIDIFDKNTYASIMSNTNNALLLEEYFFNCTSVERYDRKHKCSTLTRCPVTKNNIIAATRRQKSWDISHTFCKIREKFKEPQEVINFIVLGGSVTSGSGTWGCCCVKAIDNKCYEYGNYALVNDVEKSQMYCGAPDHERIGDVAKVCSWPRYVFNWLSKKSIATINFIDLAEGGATSAYKSERIIDQLKKKGINQLTENDIIIIDHSVNDASQYNIVRAGSKYSHDKWVSGLEKLVRRLYFFSKDESWPSVVIFEQYPWSSSRETDADSIFNSTKSAYSDVILKLLPHITYHYGATKILFGTKQ